MTEIVKLTRAFTIFEWLCRPCQEQRRRDGWTVERTGKPADPRALCADCETERQRTLESKGRS